MREKMDAARVVERRACGWSADVEDAAAEEGRNAPRNGSNRDGACCAIGVLGVRSEGSGREQIK
jgi:hypothetical protein